MRKGQYSLIEEVVLFALGISIALGFMYTFDSLRSEVGDDLRESQTSLVAGYLSSAAIEIVESGAEGQMTFRIPERIADTTYVIRMGEGGVQVQAGSEHSVSSLYGLESVMELEGHVESSDGTVSVEFEDIRTGYEGSG